MNGQGCADCRRHGFLDHSHIGSPSQNGRVNDRAFFHLGDARRYANHDARAHKTPRIVNLGDKVAQHGLGNFKVGDNAVFHGADSPDVARGSAQHALGVVPNGKNYIVAARVFFDRDHRGVAQPNSLPFDLNAGIGCAKVNGQAIVKQS